MQFLKDEIREAILNSAIEEFYEKGFADASVKDIAKATGISVGNIYRYFKNKEELFAAIVAPAYGSFDFLASSHGRQDRFREWTEMVELIGETLVGVLKDKRKELLILVNGSKGTRFENTRSKLIDIFGRHFEGTIMGYYRRTGKAECGAVVRPLSVSFLEGFFEIIRLYDDKNTIKEVTMEYVRLYFMGVKELL